VIERRTLVVWWVGLAACLALVALRLAVREQPLDRLERRTLDQGQAVYTGSWFFPRGGPYVLGFEADGDAELLIDGRLVARGRGLVLERVVFPASVVAIELRAPPATRLLWHPPGRRGPPEYVSASSLSSAAPDHARFAAAAGTDRLSGSIALAIIAIVVALVLYGHRRELARVPREVWWAVSFVFAIALAARLIDLGGAGASWDEDVNWSAGRNYVLNLLELDFRRASWQWNFEHPPMMKYIAGVGALFADGYGPARALSALVVALACALVVPVVRRLFDLETAILAGTIVALTPHIVGHSKVVGHEAPTILWWTLGVWASLRVGDVLSGDRRALFRRVLAVGIILGVAVFSRFVNVLLAPLVGAILLTYAPARARRTVFWLGVTVLPVAVLAVGYGCWPRLWPGPIDGIAEAWAKLRKPHGAELFLGSYGNTPPWHYFLVYLGATAPAGILGLALLWSVTAIRGRGPTRHALAQQRARADRVVLLWLLVPLAVALSPVRQDGVRYIMPSLVALGIAAAAGLREVGRYLERRGVVRARWLVYGSVPVYLVVVCAAIHPYYLDYYGEHVGGPRGVYEHRSFELAWWGEGLDRAVSHINRNAERNARIDKHCVIPSHLAWLRDDLWARETQSPTSADWILVYQPYTNRCPVPGDAELVFEVSAQGAPLARVYRR